MLTKFQTACGQLREIREFYLQYETEDSKKVKEGLKKVVAEINTQGSGSFLLAGSLASGMFSFQESDIDCYALFDCELVRRSNVCSYFREKLHNKIGKRIPFGILEQPDLRDINNLLEMPRIAALADVKNMFQISYPLDNSLEDTHTKLKEYTEKYGFSSLMGKRFLLSPWKQSFEKYHARLTKRGISIPDKQYELEKSFLVNLVE